MFGQRKPKDDVNSEVPESTTASDRVEIGMYKEHTGPVSGRFQGCVEGQNSNSSSVFQVDTAECSLIGVTLHRDGICYLIGLDWFK